jgi:hypothetical protein
MTKRRRVFLFGIGGPGYGKVSRLGVPLGGGPSKRKLRVKDVPTIGFTTSQLLPKRRRRR